MSIAKNILTVAVLAVTLAGVVPVASAMNTSAGRNNPGPSTNGGNSGEGGRVIIPYPKPLKPIVMRNRCTTVERIVGADGEVSLRRPCQHE
jgi:hypothetical protein